jgi:pimeloyl-ACP methyl ester carboxylesterase
MAQNSKSFVEVDGCRVEVMRGGKGAPVLFLHGAGGAGIWAPFMDKLAERYEVIVPSHPGFDRSATPEWLDNVPDLAYFYLDFIDKLGLDGIHLVGSSLGGWISAELAVRSTERLKTLTLLAAAGIHVDGVPKGDLFLWTPEQRIRNLFHNQKFADQILSIPMTEEMADIAIKNSFTTAKLAWSPRFYNRDLPKWLHRIDVPTLVVWGAEDKIFANAHAPAYAKLIPGSRVEIIPECGHVPQIEKADRFLALFGTLANGAAKPAAKAKPRAAASRKAKPKAASRRTARKPAKRAAKRKR